MGDAAGEREPTPYAERVLSVVARIPAGAVMSYGDVAEFLGEGGPRSVGTVMFRWGDRVPWHRVVMSDGRPKPFAADEHLALLADDGTPMAADGRRVDMARARWDGRPRQKSR